MGQIFVRFISIVLMEFLHQKSYVYAPKKKKKLYSREKTPSYSLYSQSSKLQSNIPLAYANRNSLKGGHLIH